MTFSLILSYSLLMNWNEFYPKNSIKVNQNKNSRERTILSSELIECKLSCEYSINGNERST